MISGSWFALLPAATASISPVRETGMRFGMVVSALAVPSLIGPVITSALIIDDSYKWAAVWVGLCCFVSGLFVNTPPAWRKWKERRAKAAGRDRECEPEALDVVPAAAFGAPRQLGTLQNEK
jgi:MFS family permease